MVPVYCIGLRGSYIYAAQRSLKTERAKNVILGISILFLIKIWETLRYYSQKNTHLCIVTQNSGQACPPQLQNHPVNITATNLLPSPVPIHFRKEWCFQSSVDACEIPLPLSVAVERASQTIPSLCLITVHIFSKRGGGEIKVIQSVSALVDSQEIRAVEVSKRVVLFSRHTSALL